MFKKIINIDKTPFSNMMKVRNKEKSYIRKKNKNSNYSYKYYNFHDTAPFIDLIAEAKEIKKSKEIIKTNKLIKVVRKSPSTSIKLVKDSIKKPLSMIYDNLS